jgi:hypothetical protein
MRQKIVASLASFGGFGGETEQEPLFDQIEDAATWTKPSYTKPGDLRELAWLGVKLCNSFLHRWFNLCEGGAEAVFYAMLTPRFFAYVDLESFSAPGETATLHSRHLLGEQDFSSEADSPALTSNPSKFEIPWRTPWLYLGFLLIVWLLLI